MAPHFFQDFGVGTARALQDVERVIRAFELDEVRAVAELLAHGAQQVWMRSSSTGAGSSTSAAPGIGIFDGDGEVLMISSIH